MRKDRAKGIKRKAGELAAIAHLGDERRESERHRLIGVVILLEVRRLGAHNGSIQCTPSIHLHHKQVKRLSPTPPALPAPRICSWKIEED